MRLFPILMSVALFSLSAAAATPVTMDFETLRVESDQGSIIHGTSYVEDGFVLSITCCEPIAGPQSTDLRTSGTLWAGFPGSTAMRGGKANSRIELTAVGGGTFDLISIDLATLPHTQVVDGILVPIDAGTPTVVTFDGLKLDGSTVTQTFSHTDFLNLTTYNFAGFSHLVSVSWFLLSGNLNEAHQFDDVRVQSVLQVSIDIKPGSDPNGVNPRSKDVIPVAVLGSIDFDATQVDSSTVVFGPDEASPVHDGHVENVNGDNFDDMVFHFKVSDTGIACGDPDATLTGETFGGDSITGTDAVKTAGCNSSGGGAIAMIFLWLLGWAAISRRSRQ